MTSQSPRTARWLIPLLCASLIGCTAQPADPPPTATTSPSIASGTPSDTGSDAEGRQTEVAPYVAGLRPAPPGAPAPPGWERQPWSAIAGDAVGQTVRWAMWGGDPQINQWVDDYVRDVAEGQLGIQIEILPLGDTVEAVNRIAADKVADRDPGSIDLLWVNGENFHTLRQGDLLYGPWAQYVPTSSLLDEDDESWQRDLGLPIGGWELPWGRAQLVMVHDTARLAEPPRDLDGLLAWIQEHPGRFTYPAPPDFTGSAFVRQVCVTLHPDEAWDQPVEDASEERVGALVGPCIERLAELAPSLWRAGESYPPTVGRLEELFANDEVELSMGYNPAVASKAITAGRFPESARTFVLEDGMLSNTHYLAVPWNAPHKAGAMVLANFLLSPAAQISKADPNRWGDPTVLALDELSDAWRLALDSVPRGPATLDEATLSAARRPEPHASWIPVLEARWEATVPGP